MFNRKSSLLVAKFFAKQQQRNVQADVKKVFLLTKNAQKIPEFKKNFSLYGVDVVQKNPNTSKEALIELLKTPNAICAIKDTTSLLQSGTDKRANVEHLELVENVTQLHVYNLDETGNDIKEKQYEHTTQGFLDMSKRVPGLLKTFGWDDIFVVKHTGLTYLELSKKGSKISSRDMAISGYIRDRFYYKNKKDLKWTPLKTEQPVDFGVSVTEFLNNSDLFNNEWARKFGLYNVFMDVTNQGVVFKSSKNRRQGNYFSTLLNPAIPLVAKRDRVHEATFMAHDIGHYSILELIYTGYEDTDAQRLTYITYRMISEAVTMMMADVMFIDTLKRSGVEYDFNSRKIYPLFQATGLDFERDGVLPALYKLCKANVAYCCKGDDTLWRELVKNHPQGEQVLHNFKDKFGPFFIEDYKWNISNYDNMTTRKEALQKWWDNIKPLRSLIPNVRAWSIDDFLALMTKEYSKPASEFNNADMVDLVFETMWKHVIVPIVSNKPAELSEDEKRYNAFVRYMMGQYAIFGIHDSVPESKMYRKLLTGVMLYKSSKRSITVTEVNNSIKFYGSFVDLLQQKNLISLDDANTFKDVYPLFEPVYVFYDEAKEWYPDLQSVYKGTFKQ